MTKSTPLVSVVIPLFNSELYIEGTLDSVAAQTYAPIEVFVIDDGSTDRSASLVQTHSLPLTYIYQTNQGVSAARNAGISRATGKYIAFLDADDKWASEKLNKQVAILEREPGFAAASGRGKYVGNLELLQHRERMPFDDENTAYKPHSMGSTLYRRELFEKIGLLDETLVHSEDVDFFLRLRDFGYQIFEMDEVVQYVEIHGKGLVSKVSEESWIMPHVIRRSMKRRRQMEKSNG